MWKCKKCDWKGKKPLIHTGEYMGKMVDILDVMCPNCPGDVYFDGTQAEEDDWWDDWEAGIK